MLPLPIWPPESNIFFNRAAQCFNAWMAHAVTTQTAIAMVTQAEFESAFKCEAIGDEDTAFNLYQWHWNPRGMLIEAKTGVDIRTERSIKRVVDAAFWELTNVKMLAWEAITTADSVHDAAVAACTLFEGAGALDSADRRGLGAERWSPWIWRSAKFLAANPAT